MKGGDSMKLRPGTLWRVPVFCIIASWLSYYITIYGGFFYVVRTTGADGAVEVSVDPLRSTLFQGVLFLAILLLGGLWAFRSMTKLEIAASAALISAVYLVVLLLQLYLPGFPPALSVWLAPFQNWKGILSSLLLRFMNFHLALAASAFAPFLFVPFGRRQKG